MAWFTNCHVNESVFLTLKGENKQLEMKLFRMNYHLSHIDPCTKQMRIRSLKDNLFTKFS